MLTDAKTNPRRFSEEISRTKTIISVLPITKQYFKNLSSINLNETRLCTARADGYQRVTSFDETIGPTLFYFQVTPFRESPLRNESRLLPSLFRV